MKTETREIYKCDHCNKLYQRKDAAIYHESICSRNPTNFRSCFGCANLGKAEATIYSGRDDYHSGGPINVTKDFLFCGAKQQFLYTPKNEIKGNHQHTDEDGNDFENFPMPVECDQRKDFDFFN